MRRLALLLTVAPCALLAAAAAEQQGVFRGSAHGVSVDVSVLDGNRPVVDLRPQDFVVYDNKVAQTVDSVSIGAAPLDVTVVLGTSDQSAAGQLRTIGADIQRIGAVLRSADRVRLLTLSNQVVDAFGWKSGAGVDAAMNVRVGGVQSLYDAVFLSLMSPPDPDRRRVVLSITDGVEFGSVLDSTTVRDVARRADAVLHLVVLDASTGLPANQPMAATSAGANVVAVPSGRPSSAPLGAYQYLRASWFHVQADVQGLDRLMEAAQLTGGTVRHATPGEPIVESFTRALEIARRSYVLRYTATGVTPQGWHDLRVDVPNGKKYTIRARQGYFGG